MKNEVVKSELLYAGHTVRLFREEVALPNGNATQLEIVRHPGASAVVPFVARDTVLLIRQYRYALRDTIYEVPAGKLDPGEDPETCAKRELEEEAGRRAGRLARLGAIWPSPGFCDETIHLFAAFDLEAVPPRRADDEVIEVVETPLARALELVYDGALMDAKSAMALLLAARESGSAA